LRLEQLEDRLAPALMVTNTLDSGTGSLRQAILDAEAASTAQTIQFNIAASGVQTINLLSPLPVIFSPMTIDGYTESGASANTLAVGDNAVLTVVLNGRGAIANGLEIQAPNVTVRGLVIQGFTNAGVVIHTGSWSLGEMGELGPGAGGRFETIAGNFIGTNAAGTAAAGNGSGSPGVAGSGGGTGGVVIQGGAHDNTVGGPNPADRNLISGNNGEGVTIVRQNSDGSFPTQNNTVQNNYVGTSVTGNSALGNTASGVFVPFAGGNRITGNLISGNLGFAGVALGGIQPGGGTFTVGAFSASAGDGSGNVVAGNLVGTNAAGTAAVPNQQHGVTVDGGSGMTIGGTTAGSGNTISGNANQGIVFFHNAQNTLVEGNRIGTTANGLAALGNTAQGVAVTDGSNHITVGGTVAGAGNLISGNQGDGVQLAGGGVTGNVVAGNFIGTNAAGTTALGNGTGVHLDSGAINNTIGGITAAARNIISGNTTDGVLIGAFNSAGTSGNVVEGNYIGTNAAGTSAVGNGGNGVFLESVLGSVSNNTVGGTATGAGNVISGNMQNGLLISAGAANIVEGNYIGTNAAGTAALGNGFMFNGIWLLGSNNIIGGTAVGAGNLISGNPFIGLNINGPGNVVQGNYIGTDITGTRPVANGTGISISESNNTIGGTTAAARNLISGNVQSGIIISGSSIHATNNVVEGNYIGTDVTGTIALGNGTGVGVEGAANNNTIGGTTAGARNIISGNQVDGVLFVTTLTTGSVTGNVVEGNYIGTNAAGTAALGNGSAGVRIGLVNISGAANNTVGGTIAGAGNVIAFNAKGVVVVDNTSTGNAIEGNGIYGNTALGIDLGDDGVTLNDSAGHNGPNLYQNYPVLTQVTAAGTSRTVLGTLKSTPSTTFRIEFFANAAYDPSGYGQGQIFLGAATVTSDTTGSAPISFTYTNDPSHPFLTATATDSANNTSEFSGRDLAPVNTVPGAQTTNENTSLTFGGARAISVRDPDNSGTDPERITLTVLRGTLTLGSLAGLAGSGNGTVSLTYTGTLANLNAALAGLRYTPATYYVGPDTLTLTTNDQAPAELGGPLSATSTVAITVVGVANPPNLTVMDTSGTEGASIPLTITARAVAPTETLSIRISGLPSSAALSAGVNNGGGVYTLTPAQLSGLTIRTTDHFRPAAVLSVTATATESSNGSTAATTRTLTVTVTDVAPTATIGNSGPINEGSSATVTFANPFSPASAVTAAGFHYSFALSRAALATAYAAAGTTPSAAFTFDQFGSYTVYGRILDHDGAFSDYTATVTVLRIAKIGVAGAAADGSALWTLYNNRNGAFGAGDATTFTFGLGTDQFLVGDWAGLGYESAGVARGTANGVQFVLEANGDNAYDAGARVFTYGASNDVVVIGDWTGDGKTKVGVARDLPDGTAQFSLNTKGDGVFGAGDRTFIFGRAKDKFGAGDWNGTGKDTVCVERAGPGGVAVFTFDTKGDGAFDPALDRVYSFGYDTDTILVGDWNGDGRTKIGVARPGPNGTMTFSLDTNGDGVFDAGDQVFTFGSPADAFLVGKWKPPAQLKAADGVLNAPAPALSLDAAFQASVNTAIDLWAQAGLDGAALARLRGLTYSVKTLGDGSLGLSEGDRIVLDATAAGHGWSEGPAPQPNQFDLVTTLAHEMGHALGLDHSANDSDVMFDTLTAGTRRAPTIADVDALFATAGAKSAS
jgi:hypothetical protein